MSTIQNKMKIAFIYSPCETLTKDMIIKNIIELYEKN